MANNATYRAKFISNLVSFVETYGFDGIDLDWEYPITSGRKWLDRINLVSLIKELRAAVNTTYGTTTTPLRASSSV